MEGPVYELHIEHDGVAISATYSAAGNRALVALHGASEGTRDYFLYRHLHDVLPAVGVGVVTFDRRGEGRSTGMPSRGRFDLQVRDCLAVVEAIDAHHVGLWGFSQGGWIAPLAAAASNRIAFLALIASTGVTPRQQMMYATAEQLRRAGHDTAVIERALSLRRRFDDWMHGRVQVAGEGLATDLQRAAAESWWPLAFLPSRLPDESGRRRWIEEMDFDPLPTFGQTRVPTLLVYGGDDSWTPVHQSVEGWRQARGGAPTVVIVPDAGHDMTLPDGKLSDDYGRILVEWLIAL